MSTRAGGKEGTMGKGLGSINDSLNAKNVKQPRFQTCIYPNIIISILIRSPLPTVLQQESAFSGEILSVNRINRRIIPRTCGEGWGFEQLSPSTRSKSPTILGQIPKHRPQGLRDQDVVEEVGEVDGYHQALLRLPCYWSQLETDGAIWRKAFYRWDRCCFHVTAK